VASVDAPMKAWQEMIEEFQKAGLGSNAPEFWQMMFAPVKQRLDLHRSGPVELGIAGGPGHSDRCSGG
jgi:hypothetical protein